MYHNNYLFSLFIFIAAFSISINKEQNITSNELKIDIFPENIKKENLKKESLQKLIDEEETHNYSFDKNRELAFINTNVPLLHGFYNAHLNHLPIRIRPDDIWLLIVQAFSNHVNTNSEKLRKYFVNFDGKQILKIKYRFPPGTNFKHLPKRVYEDFSVKIINKMEEYLGKDIIDNLTPDFSTTDYDSTIIAKLSIMGTFKKYFYYHMSGTVCGNPYIILEGTEDDYKKILSKAEKLSKYEFEWYINRIIPIIKKFIEAKQGNVDINFFKDIIQEQMVNEKFRYGRMKEIKHISGWILKFFGYKKFKGNIIRFIEDSINVERFGDLVNQMIIVPYKLINEDTKKEYDMKYKVGFIGCDQNDKDEVYPVQGWIASPSNEEELESML